jgi:hypothetical protein
MADRAFETRLHDVARRLDDDAPAFDLGRLQGAPRRRPRGKVVALVCIVAVITAPVAVSAYRHVFDVDEVPELGPLPYGVTAPFPGRTVPADAVQAETAWLVRTIPSLGAADEARVRDDITGGMVTLVYDGGRMLLTQWRSADVSARIALVPVSGKAEDVHVGDVPALWIEGTARGTFTLTGADGTTHRESFEVGGGILLWKAGEMTFLLQGAGSKVDAIRLAGDVER